MSTHRSTVAGTPDMKLFYACFISLVTTAFGFILRSLMLPEWGRSKGGYKAVILKKEKRSEPVYETV
jgi:hypothetical protein